MGGDFAVRPVGFRRPGEEREGRRSASPGQGAFPSVAGVRSRESRLDGPPRIPEFPIVHRVFRTLLTVICALYLSGAHWAVLQMTAWTGMLVTRTQQAGVEEAVRTTFDGTHPCGLCAAITTGQKEERQEMPEVPALKKLLEFKSVTFASFAVARPLALGEITWSAFVAEDGRRLDAPPTPPPVA